MSVNINAYQQYRNSTVETASPGTLLLMLYDAAIQNLEGAKRAIEGNDMAGAHNYLTRAQDIVLELMSTLNMEYQISKSLWSLYDYLYRQLVQANVKKSLELVEEVYGFMTELRDTWREAVRKAGRTAAVSCGKSQGICMEG
ncbi:MAG: flagellar export chaperone FliS [Syntrophothermus sp.]|uniref:flagellar export chaperone FliS n=1 Tax=Syntrophothermus sp. TaxID=2736299 RepID=UPI00257D3FFE|nr:flagellar export chaperone FliS [Syntrophothermus sp.]NSW83193.1 flagellar export chaperone FliS [Syntrophothermus sp.]